MKDLDPNEFFDFVIDSRDELSRRINSIGGMKITQIIRGSKDEDPLYMQIDVDCDFVSAISLFFDDGRPKTILVSCLSSIEALIYEKSRACMEIRLEDFTSYQEMFDALISHIQCLSRLKEG